MPDSVSYGRPDLYSDGMSGGTGFFFVAPWDCHPRSRRRKSKARKASPRGSSRASSASEVPA